MKFTDSLPVLHEMRFLFWDNTSLAPAVSAGPSLLVNSLEPGEQFGCSIFDARRRVHLSWARHHSTMQFCSSSQFPRRVHLHQKPSRTLVSEHQTAHSDSDFEETTEEHAKKTKSRAKTSTKNDPRAQFDELRCLDAAYDDPEFRRWTAKETYIFLRQTKPDLMPWQWNDGVWSTNMPSSEGTLFGGCSYMQSNTGRANEENLSSLVLRSTVNIYWECGLCLRTHMLYNATRGVPSLLGSGQLSKKDWVGYFTNSTFCIRSFPVCLMMC